MRDSAFEIKGCLEEHRARQKEESRAGLDLKKKTKPGIELVMTRG